MGLGQKEPSDRERHYHCELQEEMQPGSGQILGAVRGSGSD